jgi:hypothetical protein
MIEQGREISVPFMQFFQVSGNNQGHKRFSKYPPEIICLVLDARKFELAFAHCGQLENGAGCTD